MAARNWDGAHWRKRLEQIVTFSQKEDIRRFFLEKVEPAFSELQTELEKYGIQSEILKGKNGPLSIEALRSARTNTQLPVWRDHREAGDF